MNGGFYLEIISKEFDYRLSKDTIQQPYKINDIIQIENKHYLIIGIEWFEVISPYLIRIRYTLQHGNTSKSKLKMHKSSNTMLNINTNFGHKSDKYKLLKLGTVHNINGLSVRLVGYNSIRIDGIVVHLVLKGEIVYGVPSEDYLKLMIKSRMKQLNLSIVKGE